MVALFLRGHCGNTALFVKNCPANVIIYWLVINDGRILAAGVKSLRDLLKGGEHATAAVLKILANWALQKFNKK